MALEQIDTVVIGAGVVGLACARALALAGREVMVLESAGAIGTGISARNSEVVHAGIYYLSGSLKAQHCVTGKQLLYTYCQARGIAHQRCGKLIVATTPSQQGQLLALQQRALANGVGDVQLLSAAQARALEPHLRCESALFSPSSGIVDSHALMLALQGDLEQAGGMVVLNTTVQGAEVGPQLLLHTVNTHTQATQQLQAQIVVNAAGLQAVALAQAMQGYAAQHVPAQWFAKGSYFGLAGKAPFSHLIYPVPKPGGLGVHLTLDLGGQAKFGPDVQWLDASAPAPFDYAVDVARATVFYDEVRKYWPGLPEGVLTPAYSGVRPKLHGLDALPADFMISGPSTHNIGGLVQLFGMESPGLTASLSIAQHVLTLVA
jgi:L-2-hydroxyglutarate oxidase LhgO